jgi:exodeoxyribonuclease V alpha subunit
MNRPKIHASEQLARFFAPENPQWAAIIAKLYQQLEQGHTCLRLDAEEQQHVTSLAEVSTDGTTAFVLDGDYLYFQRYWQHECTLAGQLRRLAKHVSTQELALDAYFADEYQRAAADLVLCKQLAVITGGPGTGKTTTVVKILALLQAQTPTLKIKLAAPTGKAAARLSESILNGKRDTQYVRPLFAEQLDALDAVPEAASTIHSLLGVIHGSPDFKHDATHPLDVDVLVIDEASMVDIGMMQRLVSALPPQAKLVLMGDADQLASVEAGAVLAAIAAALPDNRVHLRTTYRFSGAIKALAQAVNAMAAADFGEVLATKDDMVAVTTGDPVAFAKRAYTPYLASVAHFEQHQDSVHDVFRAFAAFQVLCATRADKLRFDAIAGQSAPWYSGKPVMILQNQAEIGLYNGDIGIALRDESGVLRVYFPIAGKFIGFLPSQLPVHETAYAMTIHKSQGSEFAHVLLMLPELSAAKSASEQLANLLTKELLYTGITRAKNKITLYGAAEDFAHVISRKITRQGLLAERISSG